MLNILYQVDASVVRLTHQIHCFINQKIRLPSTLQYGLQYGLMLSFGLFLGKRIGDFGQVAISPDELGTRIHFNLSAILIWSILSMICSLLLRFIHEMVDYDAYHFENKQFPGSYLAWGSLLSTLILVILGLIFPSSSWTHYLIQQATGQAMGLGFLLFIRRK